MSGYIKPRPQIDYPDGCIVYLDATTTAASSQPALVPPSFTSGTSTQLPASSPASPSLSGGPVIAGNYQLWARSEEILVLQKFLNTHGFVLAASGPGSPGQETSIFGRGTYRALVKFQHAHNIPATGYLGPLTRAAIASTSPSN